MPFRHNSTIAIKEQACIRCGRIGPIFSKKRCQSCATIEDTQKRMEKETEKVIEEEDLSGLIQDADAIFSQYIRLKYADKRGMVKCYTCDTIKHWTMMQNGHFVKRQHLYLRWSESNCRPQDAECNEIKSGNFPVFATNLEKESAGSVDFLHEQMRLVYKPTREEIRQVISQYTPLVKSMKAKLIPT